MGIWNKRETQYLESNGAGEFEYDLRIVKYSYSKFNRKALHNPYPVSGYFEKKL
jgi:hypothetical protein